MIAKVAFFVAALAAARASGLLAPAVYGHGLAIKAPAPPLLHTPFLHKTVIAPAGPLLHTPVLHAPVLAKHVVAAPAYSVSKSVVTTHHGAPVAYAAPLPYAVAKAGPVHYTTTLTGHHPVAPVLAHTGLFGAAPLAYTGHLPHGVVAGHGLAYSGHHGLVHHTGLLGPAKYGYGKVLL